MAKSGAFQILRFGLEGDCHEEACLLIDICRNVDFTWDERHPVFSPRLKRRVVRSIPSRAVAPVGPPMIHFPWKGWESGSGEYLKLVDEEPTVVMSNGRNSSGELPRDPEIVVTLFQNINEAGPLPSR